MSRRSDNLLVVAIVVIMIAAGAWFFAQSGSDSTPTSVGTQSDTSPDWDESEWDEGSSGAASASTSGPVLIDATISVNDLPDEAIDTMALIRDDGPFPYSKDGSVFQNREGRLPDNPTGYYREYTVETPGSSDRGARRIVGGDDGELFYTSDHYDSFSQIVG